MVKIIALFISFPASNAFSVERLPAAISKQTVLTRPMAPVMLDPATTVQLAYEVTANMEASMMQRANPTTI